MLHEQHSAVFLCRREQQVDMVGHEDVSVDFTAELVGELFEVVEVALIVRFSVEANSAIDSALDDMPGDAGK